MKNREIYGTSHFCVEELRRDFPEANEQQIKTALYRLSVKKIIKSVYNGFYVITPVMYLAKGEIPPEYYIDQLMTYINKPYYMSLLSAASFHGASHQAAQVSFVTALMPQLNVSSRKNNTICWVYRAEIPERFLLTVNSQTGTIRYSCAELTAVDIIQYQKHIGGLSRAATLLLELFEATDFTDKIEGLLQFSSLTTIQRLGYIAEVVLEERDQADIIHEQLLKSGRRLNYVPLSSQSPYDFHKVDKRWKIYINTQIEVDDI